LGFWDFADSQEWRLRASDTATEAADASAMRRVAEFRKTPDALWHAVTFWNSEIFAFSYIFRVRHSLLCCVEPNDMGHGGSKLGSAGA
jgi:hypothetical protein